MMSILQSKNFPRYIGPESDGLLWGFYYMMYTIEVEGKKNTKSDEGT